MFYLSLVLLLYLLTEDVWLWFVVTDITLLFEKQTRLISIFAEAASEERQQASSVK